MTFALCATCRRAVFSWETPSLIEGLPADVEWSHYVAAKYGEDGEHHAVPARSLRDRTLHCSTCRQPQALGRHGWECGNIHCPSKVDKG